MAILNFEQLCNEAMKATRALERELFPAYPMPRLLPEPSIVIALYTGLYADDGILLMRPPSYAVSLAPDGRLLRLYRVEPEDFGMAPDTEQPTKWKMDSMGTREQSSAARNRLANGYDELLPAFFARSALTQIVVEAARDFQKMFWRLSEPLLEPCYRQLGREFLDWINQTAR